MNRRGDYNLRQRERSDSQVAVHQSVEKHPSHSAPNRRLPVYPAGETLILGGGSETAGVVNCNSAFCDALHCCEVISGHLSCSFGGLLIHPDLFAQTDFFVCFVCLTLLGP